MYLVILVTSNYSGFRLFSVDRPLRMMSNQSDSGVAGTTEWDYRVVITDSKKQLDQSQNCIFLFYK